GVAWYLEGDTRGVGVGHDTRFSAELFAREVARVLAANGQNVLLLDHPVPTPTITWTVVERHQAGAVAVTASHNPAEFNGLKYKPDYGGSAAPEVVEQLEKHTRRALEGGVLAVPLEGARASGGGRVVDPTPDSLRRVARLIYLQRLRDAGLRILHEP